MEKNVEMKPTAMLNGKEVVVRPLLHKNIDYDMQLTCEWCGKEFNPHINFCGESFYPVFHCSWRCYRKSNSPLGALKSKLDKVTYIIWRKPFYKVRDYIHYETCPICRKQMHYLFPNKDNKSKQYICYDCFESFERELVLSKIDKVIPQIYLFKPQRRPDFFLYFKVGREHWGLHIHEKVVKILIKHGKIKDGMLGGERVRLMNTDNGKLIIGGEV